MSNVSHMRRWARAGLIALGLGAVLAGCGAQAASSPPKAHAPVSIVYWAGHASGALHAAVVAEVAQFNQTHPGIHVTFVVRGASHHGLEAFEAGQAPNVGMVSAYIVPQLVQAGALVPLTSYLNGPNGLTAADIHNLYYPAVWNDMKEGTKIQYMMPLEKKSIVVLYYNEALFRKAGISTPPRTWAQVGADAAKITALGPQYHGIAWTPYLQQFFDMVLADGGRIFTTQTGRRAYSLDNRGGREALTMLRSWIQNGSMILTTGYEYQLDFGTGDVGMLIDTSAGYTYDKSAVGGKFVMGGTPAPAGTSGHSAQYINGASLVMFNVGTAAQKAASWTFMKWMSSPATNVYWDEHTNYLPLGPQEAALMRAFYAAHPAQAASFSNPAYWWFKPRTPNFEASVTPMQAVLEQALQGKIGIPAALQQMSTVGTQYLSGKVRG